MKGVVWNDESLGAEYHDIDIPADMLDQAQGIPRQDDRGGVRARRRRIDRLSRRQDARRGDAEALIRKAVITGAFFPVLCGSAFKNKGVQPLLDAVVDYLPSPLDVPPIHGINPDNGEDVVREPKDDAPLALLAFKIMDDPFVGTITFCRIYSGTLTSGTGVINSTKERKERIGRMLLMHANNREDIKEAYAGDIVALAGLKEARTGDTLCDPQAAGDSGKDGIPRSGDRDRDRAEVEGRPGKARRRARQTRAPRIRRSASRPTRRAARPSSRAWASCISTSRSTSSSAPTRSTPISARRRWPSARRSRRRSSIDYTHKKQTGGSGQFAAIKIVVRADRARHGFEFENEDRRRHRAEGIHPRRREGPRIGARLRRARRLPGGRPQGDADRRQLSRRRLVGARLRNLRARSACAKRCRRRGPFCSSRS